MTQQADTERPRFRRPFVVPDSLDDLKGPATGMVTIPRSVDWAKPELAVINTASESSLKLAYRETLGSAIHIKDLVSVVNKDHLMRLWPQLLRDRLIRKTWEDRFPELKDTYEHGR